MDYALGIFPELGLKIFWGYSILYKQFLLREDAPRSVGSVGRAHRSHRWGHWFESSKHHHYGKPVNLGFTGFFMSVNNPGGMRWENAPPLFILQRGMKRSRSGVDFIVIQKVIINVVSPPEMRLPADETFDLCD